MKHSESPSPGNKDNFLPEAKTLAKMGALTLLVDAPWASKDFGLHISQMVPGAIRDMYIQAIADFRRGIDLIDSQMDTNLNCIGYVGHSFGALLGGILAGVERRIKAYVLMAGVGSFTDIALANMPNLNGAALEEFRKAFEPIDPVHYVGHAAPSELFFQFGSDDIFFPNQKFLKYYIAGSQPKTIKWYNADHYGLNEKGCLDRIAWLKAQLSLK